jgi:hypothetical protein
MLEPETWRIHGVLGICQGLAIQSTIWELIAPLRNMNWAFPSLFVFHSPRNKKNEVVANTKSILAGNASYLRLSNNSAPGAVIIPTTQLPIQLYQLLFDRYQPPSKHQ